jgi:hypothetical protein
LCREQDDFGRFVTKKREKLACRSLALLETLAKQEKEQVNDRRKERDERDHDDRSE